ncbi:hypothetical protein BZA77DRAFT_74341 [Pyronema omphalodes]|nr:hypothetical protein BZA77DRAFT_74341 [Pyronema omphalodes]
MPSNYHPTNTTVNSRYEDSFAAMATVTGNGNDYEVSYDHDTVLVTKEEYESLRTCYNEYHALRNTLLNGGVTEENLQILITTGLAAAAAANPPLSPQLPPTPRSESTPLFATPTRTTIRTAKDPNASTNGSYDGKQGNGIHGTRGDGHIYGNGSHAHRAADSYPSPERESSSRHAAGGHGYGYTNNHHSTAHANSHANHNGNDGQVVESKARRTLFFCNLPKDATYADLVAVVKGGPLVDVWMKNQDHCASVSFVNPEDADNYLRWAKRNGVVVLGRRVEIRYREPSRQFTILRNVLRQIQNDGASRVLRLRKVSPSITDQRLRDDLDHIANLRIEKLIRTSPSEIICNLNSVCAALFARTCLRSRAAYKGCKIEFGIDDCAQPLPDQGGNYYGKQEKYRRVSEDIRGRNRFDVFSGDMAFAEDGGEELQDVEFQGGSETTETQEEDMEEDLQSWADETADHTDGGADLSGYWA